MRVKIIRVLSFLNLDVALGACAISYLISGYLDVKLPFFAYLLLFMAVFCIYLADHLFDNFKIKESAISERRQFYRANSTYLYFLLFTIVCSGFAVSIVHLPNVIFARAYMMVVCVAVYLVFDHIFKAKLIPKELIIAVLYVAGVGFYPIMLQNTVYWDGIILLLAVLLIAIENLLLYSIIDFQDDIVCGLASFATGYGIGFTKNIISSAFIINFVVIMALQIFYPQNWIFHLIVAIIHVTQIFVYYNREKLQKNALYRWIADGIFSLPFALLLID
jgi:4-hydroxybenzoate polyprenyltransferase